MAGPLAALIIQFGILLSALFFVAFTYCETFAGSMILSESETKVATTGTLGELQAEGLRFQEAGQFEATIEKYKAALTKAQNAQNTRKVVTLYTLLGGAYARLGRWQDAVGAYQQIVRLQPYDAAAHAGLGQAYSNLKRWQAATKAYKQG